MLPAGWDADLSPEEQGMDLVGHFGTLRFGFYPERHAIHKGRRRASKSNMSPHRRGPTSMSLDIAC